jgi:hypothetical protein
MWSDEEEAKGGQCLVNCKRVCALRKYGGLDLKDITTFSRSLRPRWLCFHRDPSDRPLKGMVVPCDAIDRDIFDACTLISIDNGTIARF